MLDWLLGVAMVAILILAVFALAREPVTLKPTNEQIAACVLSCKGHLTEMIEYGSNDVAKDGSFTCHCKMAFKISKDGSNIVDAQ
jgi:hypothetical protein